MPAMYSRSDLQFLHFSLWSPSTRLSARLDSKLAINIKLSRNFISYVIVLWFSFFFFDRYRECSVFLCEVLKLPFKLFRQLLDCKMVVIIRTIMEHQKSFLLVSYILGYKYCAFRVYFFLCYSCYCGLFENFGPH